MFKGLSAAKNCLKPESAPLNVVFYFDSLMFAKPHEKPILDFQNSDFSSMCFSIDIQYHKFL